MVYKHVGYAQYMYGCCTCGKSGVQTCRNAVGSVVVWSDLLSGEVQSEVREQ